jgi:hypothetical protein
MEGAGHGIGGGEGKWPTKWEVDVGVALAAGGATVGASGVGLDSTPGVQFGPWFGPWISILQPERDQVVKVIQIISSQ